MYHDGIMKDYIKPLQDIVGTSNDGYDVREEVSKVNNRVDEVSSQLEHKANKVYVTPEEFGAKGDGVLVNTTITIKDKSYPIKKYIGSDDTESFKRAIDYCTYNKLELRLLDKNYILQNDVVINNSITITGNGNNSKIIKGSIVINENVNDILIKNIAIVGEYDIFTPPLRITTNSNVFNEPEYWNYLDFTNMGYGADGITIYGNSKNPSSNITIENCYFSMRCNGVRTTNIGTPDNYCIKNLIVKECVSDHIWWHGVGTRYAEGVIVEGCIFRNHYVGMMCDFSRGTKDSIMTNCKGYSVANFFKNESDKGYINKNCIISNNTWYSPMQDEPNYKWYVGHTTGENIIVENNQIFVRDVINGFRISGQNSAFINNHITIDNFIGETYLFEIYNYLDITGDLILEGNSIYNKTSHKIKVVKSDTVNTNRVIIKNNEFIGTFSNIVLGKKVKYLNISNNRGSGIEDDLVNIVYAKNLIIDGNVLNLNNTSILTLIRNTYEQELIENISIRNNTIRNIYNVVYIPNLFEIDNISIMDNDFYNLSRVLMYFGDFKGGNILNENNCGILKIKDNNITLTDDRANNSIVYIHNNPNNITWLENTYVNKRTDISSPYTLHYDLRGSSKYIKKDYGLNVTVVN